MDNPHREQPPLAAGERLVLAVILGLFILAGLSVLPVPFTRDQGVYAYGAWRWMSGGVPYADSFDHKGPLLYAVYAAGLALSGDRPWGVNLLDLIARASAVAFLWAAARRMFGPRAALLAATLTAMTLFGAFNAAWVNAQAETFALPLLAAAAWLVAGGGGPRRACAAAAAGLLAGQAVMLKPTALLSVVVLWAWAWRRAATGAPTSVGAGRLARWREPLAFKAAGAAGVLAWLAYFAAHGALGRMWESLVLFNAIHASAGAGAQAGGWPLFARWIGPVFGAAPLLAPLLLLRGGFPRDAAEQARARDARLLAAAWLAAGVLQVIVQAKYFEYHWLAAALPLGLTAGAGLDALATWLETDGRRRLALVCVGLALAGIGVPHALRWARTHVAYRTWSYATGALSPNDFAARFRETGPGGTGDFNLLASRVAAAALRDQTAPGSRVLVFGFEPLVNFLAGRPAPTRFCFDYPLTFSPRNPRESRLRDRWRAEFLRDLRATPPEVVLLVDNDVNPLEPQSSLVQARAWPDFAAWLAERYDPAGALEDFVFFQRKR